MVACRVVNRSNCFLRLWAGGEYLQAPPLDHNDAVVVDLAPGSLLQARSLLDESVVEEVTVGDGGTPPVVLTRPSRAMEAPAGLPAAVPGLPAAPRVLTGTGTPPDLTRDFVTAVEEIVPAGDDLTFNTRVQPQRRAVTLTGVELRWAFGQRELMAYCGEDALDICELTMVADRVVFAAPVRIPGAHVTIHARLVEFTGDGCLDTTPVSWQLPARSPVSWMNADDPDDHAVYPGEVVVTGIVDGRPAHGVARAAQGRAGARGQAGGRITINAREVRLPAGADAGPRLIARGGGGQAGEPGGLVPRDPRDKARAPVTRDDIAAAFSHEFSLSKSLGDWSWPSGALDHFKPRVEAGAQDGDVIFLRLYAADPRGMFFGGSNYMVFPGTFRLSNLLDEPVANPAGGGAYGTYATFPMDLLRTGLPTKVDAKEPAPPPLPPGPDAYPGGAPGAGGAGGSITWNLGWALLRKIAVVSPGSPGQPTAAVEGGAPRVPATARFMDVIVSKNSESVKPWVRTTEVTADHGAPAVGASAAVGAPGRFRSGQTPWTDITGAYRRVAAPVGHASDWLHPAALDAVLAAARSLFRLGFRKEAWGLLEPYRAELLAACPPDATPHLVQIETIRQRLIGNLDHAGHPPGYVPRTSALASFYTNQTMRAAAARIVSYAEASIAAFDHEQDRQRADEAARAALRARIATTQASVREAATRLDECAQRLEEWVRQVQAKDAQASMLVEQLRVNVADQERSHQLYRGVMHLLAGALQSVPVYQPYLGLAGSVVGSAAEVDPDKPFGDQVAERFGDVGKKVTTFLDKHKELVAFDYSHDPGQQGRRDDSHELGQMIRDAQADQTSSEQEVTRASGNLTEATAAMKEVTATHAAAQTEYDEARAAWTGTVTDAVRKAADQRATVDRAAAEVRATRTPEARKRLQRAQELLKDRIENVTKAKAELAALAERAAEAKAGLDVVQQRKAELTRTKTDLDAAIGKSKEDQEIRARLARQTCERLAGVGAGLGEIGTGLAALARPVTPEDPAVLAEVQTLLAGDGDAATAYRALRSDYAALAASRDATIARLVQARDTLASGAAEIASSLDQLAALSTRTQHRAGLTDARLRQHLEQLRDRGREMAQQSVDAFLAALRYELVLDIPPDALDVDAAARKVAALRAGDAASSAADIETAVNTEFWAGMVGIAKRVVKESQSRAGVDTRKARVSLVRSTSRDARARNTTRILDELSTTGTSRVRAVEDLHLVPDYGTRSARIQSVTITGMRLGGAPPRDDFYIDVDVRHSGRQVLYEKKAGDAPLAYYFFQSGSDDPIAWSGRATFDHDGAGTVANDEPATQGREQLLNLLLKDKVELPTPTVSLATYHPGLYGELVLVVRPDVDPGEPCPAIDAISLEVTLTVSQHDTGT